MNLLFSQENIFSEIRPMTWRLIFIAPLQPCWFICIIFIAFLIGFPLVSSSLYSSSLFLYSDMRYSYCKIYYYLDLDITYMCRNDSKCPYFPVDWLCFACVSLQLSVQWRQQSGEGVHEHQMPCLVRPNPHVFFCPRPGLKGELHPNCHFLSNSEASKIQISYILWPKCQQFSLRNTKIMPFHSSLSIIYNSIVLDPHCCPCSFLPLPCHFTDGRMRCLWILIWSAKPLVHQDSIYIPALIEFQWAPSSS